MRNDNFFVIISFAASLLLGILSGCPPAVETVQDRVDPTRQRTVEVSEELSRLSRMVDKLVVQVELLTADLRVVAATSQCKPEVQKAFADLRNLCLKGACIKQTDAAGVLIDEAGGFMVLLQSLPHEAFYFDKEEPLLNDDREKWLDRLASQVTQNTQFLILAFVDNVWDKNGPETIARERAKKIRDKLGERVRENMKNIINANTKVLLDDSDRDVIEKKVIAERMKREVDKVDAEYANEKQDKFLMGIVDLPLSPKVLKLLRPNDLPQSQLHEPTNKPKRSVWVFRVNC